MNSPDIYFGQEWPDSSDENFPTAARRIPPELFKKIIANLLPENDCWLVDKQGKRELGHYSLVCRYWGKRCRPAMFRRISLASYEDARQLLSFANRTTAGMNIKDYIVGINLNVILPSPPWIHLILHAAPHGLLTTNIYVDFTCAELSCDTPPPKVYAPRSAFQDLPRSLPIVPAQTLTHVFLRNVRFLSFSDFVSFLASLPPCGEISLEYVTWEDMAHLEPTAPPSLHALHRKSRDYVPRAAKGCTGMWPLVWLRMRTRRPECWNRIVPPLYLDPVDAHRTIALVKTVFDSCKCQYHQASYDAKVRSSVKDAVTSIGPLVCFSVTHLWSHQLEFDVLPGPGLVKAIRITIIYQSYSPFTTYTDAIPPEAFQFDWAVLDKQMSAFDMTLESVHVILSEKMFAEYEPYVRMHMPLTQAGGRLQVEMEIEPKK